MQDIGFDMNRIKNMKGLPSFEFSRASLRDDVASGKLRM
jgi:hypothetical protein